jgi:hypothetical protein
MKAQNIEVITAAQSQNLIFETGISPCGAKRNNYFSIGICLLNDWISRLETLDKFFGLAVFK